MEKKKPNAFAAFFAKLPQLLLAGLLFSVFFAAFMTLSVLAAKLFGFDNVIVWALGIIPSAVFLPGLVMVVRKYAAEKQFVPVVRTFFAAVKENARDFIFHGVIMYVIVISSFFALLYYFTQAQADIVFAYILVIYILFTAIMTAMLFYVPLMAVTYRLRYRDIYKNSLLLIFGKILPTLLAFVLVAVVTGAGVMLLVCTEGVWRIVSAAALTALMPLLVCYITIAVLSKGVQENVGSFVQPAEELAPVSDGTEADEQKTLDSAGEEYEYVFVNGRMVKNPKKKR